MEMVKDPVCGMMVDPESSLAWIYHTSSFYFCSDLCKWTFLKDPEKFVGKFGSPAFNLGNIARRIAYFPMEVGVESEMPIYSGGLGILAGDTLKSCADLKVPTVGVTLFHAHGYFDQTVDESGNQQESPSIWNPSHSIFLWNGVTVFNEPMLLAVTHLLSESEQLNMNRFALK